MLGELARWLRLLGYDTLYSREIIDEELISLSKEQERVLLTCDRELHRRALKQGIRSVLLKPDESTNRLATVARAFGLELNLDPSLSRCPICNGKIKRVVDSNTLEGIVPQKVRDAHREFWTCTNCGKVYWIGGHWKNISNTVNEARRLARELSSK